MRVWPIVNVRVNGVFALMSSGVARVTIATPVPKLLLRKPPGTV